MIVAQGVAFHHVSDSIFHDLSAFRELVRDSASNLGLLGVSKGAARAAAHIGIELLLDAALFSREHQEAYRLALAIASPSELGSELYWDEPGGTERFEEMRLRLLERMHHTYDIVDNTTARLVYALADRPRLRLTVGDQVGVKEWLRTAAPQVERAFSALWLDLVQRVSSHWSDCIS